MLFQKPSSHIHAAAVPQYIPPEKVDIYLQFSTHVSLYLKVQGDQACVVVS